MNQHHSLRDQGPWSTGTEEAGDCFDHFLMPPCTVIHRRVDMHDQTSSHVSGSMREQNLCTGKTTTTCARGRYTNLMEPLGIECAAGGMTLKKAATQPRSLYYVEEVNAMHDSEDARSTVNDDTHRQGMDRIDSVVCECFAIVMFTSCGVAWLSGREDSPL